MSCLLESSISVLVRRSLGVFRVSIEERMIEYRPAFTLSCDTDWSELREWPGLGNVQGLIHDAPNLTH